jgi:hypothetical protein
MELPDLTTSPEISSVVCAAASDAVPTRRSVARKDRAGDARMLNLLRFELERLCSKATRDDETGHCVCPRCSAREQ